MAVSPLLGSPKPQFFDNNGVPLVGGTVEFFAAGTSTPLDTYTDTGGLTPNTNPIVLDSRGEPPMQINGTDLVGYKAVLKSLAGDVIWTQDNIFSANSTGGGVAPPPTFPFLNGTLFKSVSFTVGAADRGKLIVATANTFTVSLNVEVGIEGFVIAVINRGDGLVTLVAGEFDQINGYGNITLKPGEFIILTADGVSQWNGPHYIQGIPIAVASGTVNAMTATFALNNVLVNGLLIQVKPVAAISSTTPTLAIDGLPSKTIVKDKDAALEVANIDGPSQTMLLQYDATLDKWILLNPVIPAAAPKFRGALVYKSINQSAPANATTFVTFDLTDYDVGQIHDPITNNTRLVVPLGASLVKVSGKIAVVIATNYSNIEIRKNGSLVFIGSVWDASASFNEYVAHTPILSVVPGDYFELSVTETGSTGGNIISGPEQTWFAMDVVE